MFEQLRTCNFGLAYKDAIGPTGVGYTVYDYTGEIITPRTATGVFQIVPGIYSAYISFPDNFHGQVVWDTGSTFPETYYATEQFNYEENNPKIDNIYDIEHGRWRIVDNTMIFYKEDNITEVARFNLFDASGNPTMDSPFERRRS